jgi:hypothetical protein
MGGSFSIKNKDKLLETLLSLGEGYRPLLRWVEIPFPSASGLTALGQYLGSPMEGAWGGTAERLLIPLLSQAPLLDSAIISNCPDVFAEFRVKPFWLLWRGGCDHLGVGDFYSRCYGHTNTVTVLLHANGNRFGGFVPVK